MTKELVISTNRHETKLAVLEDGQLVEVFFQRANEYSLVGSIHKGRVTRVLPGMQSAFVNIGLERDAFLYVSDFFEGGAGDDEGYDRLGGEERGRRQPPPAVTPPAGEGEAAAATETAGEDRADRPERGDRGGRRSRRRRRGSGGRGGFPEAKFAAPGATAASPGEEKTGEAAVFTGPAEDEPFVLPGESLAKYRGRDGAEPDEFEALADEHPSGETDAEALEPARAMTEEEVTGAIEEAVEARLEELGASRFEDSSEEDLQRAAEEALASEDIEPEPAAASALESAPDAETGYAPESETAGEPGEESEDAIEPGDEAEAVSGEPAEGSAEIREQPAARYIQPRSNRMRRRGRRGGRREQGPRDYAAAPADGDAQVAERSQREDRPERGERTERPERGDRRERGDRAEGERPPMPSITDLLKEGQEIIVQIAKEPLGQKGARITSHVAIPGRYVVFMPTLDHHGVSRKVGTDEERLRLKRILSQHSQGMTGGFIVRTAGEGKPESEIAADMNFLYNLWLDIRKKAEKRPAPALLHHDLELVQRTLRDQVNEQFKSVWVDNEEAFESILAFMERFQPGLVNRVKLYTRPLPIFDAFNITSELEKALRPKVWLKSGGYIVINQTEALVAIDVNTGKYVGKSNRLEDTIVKTNTEAVKEIARQIRLRDLGGIIVVDFIDMDERRNRQKVMQALEEAMRSDRAPYKILQFNDFGLVAITRRRVKQSLERALCQPCPTCEGSGYIKSSSTVMSEILTEAHKIAPAIENKECVLRVHPDVAKVIKSTENHYLEEIEEILARPVLVMADPLLHPEKFDLA